MNNGAFGENFPYSNFHDMNTDWLIKIAKDFLDQYTHIQEVITDGEQSLLNLTSDGLEQLQTKADTLENLLQQWYDTHSEDIANQLANALADLNTQLANNIATFNQQADQKAQQTIASIPEDYTDLFNRVNKLYSEITEKTDNIFCIAPGNVPELFTTGYKGIVVTKYLDGSFELHGTSDSANILIGESIGSPVVATTPWLPAGTYSFGLEHISGTVSSTADGAFSVRAGTSNTIALAMGTGKQQSTLTFAETSPCYIRCGASITYNHFRVRIMINSGSVLLPYVPMLTAYDFRARKEAHQATSNISASEYIDNTAYSSGDYVWKDGILYKAKVDISGEVWTSGHWQETTVTDAIKSIVSEICYPYDSTKQYVIGEYCRYYNRIYKCKTGTPSGGEPWTSGHWTLVTSDVMNASLNTEKELENILPYIPNLTENKINSASFEVPYERYENIQYIDVVGGHSAISAYDNANVAIDNKVRLRNAPFSLKFTTDPEQEYSRCRIRLSTGIPIIGTQEIEVYLYTENASLIDGQNHRLRLQGADTGFSKYYDTALVNGWNRIRFSANGAGTIPDYTVPETDFRLFVYTTSEINIWIGGIYVVKPDKANIIIIDDAPYQSFFDYAYNGQNGLKANNIPVTWAIDPTFIGDADHPRIISQADFDSLAYDGLSEFSFHSYDGTDMTGATAETALSDTLNCIRYLKKNGLEPERIFRAAWFHNDCTHPELANEILDASASYNGSSGLTQFPFPDRYNIPRYPMQGRTTSIVDSIFEALENQHCTILMYTHGISDLDTDTSTTLMSYYISKIVAGVQAGWLRATTYNRMMNHYRRIE